MILYIYFIVTTSTKKDSKYKKRIGEGNLNITLRKAIKTLGRREREE